MKQKLFHLKKKKRKKYISNISHPYQTNSDKGNAQPIQRFRVMDLNINNKCKIKVKINK